MKTLKVCIGIQINDDENSYGYDDNDNNINNENDNCNNNNNISDAPPVAESSTLLHVASQLTSSCSIEQPLLLSLLPFLPDYHAPKHQTMKKM
jgi:hypothetical protein